MGKKRSTATDRWLLDSLADGVVLIDEDWRVAYVNAAAESLLSIEDEAVRGQPATGELLNVPSGWMSLLDQTMRSRESGKLATIQLVLSERHRYYEGEVHASPTGGIALLFRDVTDLKEDEEVLRLRDRAIAATPNGVIITDATQPDNPVIYVNPAFEEITGYSAEETLGRNCRFLQGEDRDQPGLQEIRDAVREGRSCTAMLRNIRKDGTPFWSELSIAPVRDEAGELTHFVGIQLDVTSRKRVQDDLVERNEELKAARDELAKRNAELREATRAKDRFMATMSHEMRTPLNAVLGYVELLNLGVAGELTDEQRAQLARISASGRALLDLINDVLDFTRAEAGRLSIEARPLNARAVLEEAIELVRVQAEGKGISIEVVQPAEPLPWVMADFRRLRQILTNLLSNAVKFTMEGSITVTFSAAEDDLLSITVRDTGIGIDSEQLRHVFTEFYQADSNLTREYGGTGLGLAISKRLAQLLGGDITAESEVGKGSAFTLTLRTASPAERRRQAAAPEKRVEDIGDERPLTVGVPVVAFGEDEAVLDSLRRQLEPGVRLIGTTVAGSVPDLARRESATLVVLDIGCQQGAGWEAAHALREDAALDDVAMLLLPGLPTSFEHGAPGALDLGWVAVVPKPYAADQLTRVVARAGRSADSPEGMPQDILVVDDDPDARQIAARVLGAGGATVRESPDGEAGLLAMREKAPDVAVLDLMMPVLDGFGVLAAMRSDPSLRDIPVVVLTAKDLSEPERKFLSRTAETVLQKGIHPLSDVATLVLQAANRNASGQAER